MLEGVIVFLRINIGSKSEGLHPFLYQGDGKLTKVWKFDDYSFQGNLLKEYDGKRVKIDGTLTETETFVIKEIELVDCKTVDDD